MVEYAEITAVASRALAHAGTPATLRVADVVVDYPGSATAILRCVPAGAAPSLPASLVVKRWNGDDGGGFRREWAALEYLERIGPPAGLVPTVYGGDDEAKLLVLEDLAGPGERSGLDSPDVVGNILFGDDPGLAEAALVALNRSLASLHAATIGRTGAYRSSQLRRRAAGNTRHGVHRLGDGLARFADVLAASGVAVTTAVAAELAQAAAELRDPGPFLAFTHGDATPSNALIRDGRARLFDLEAADVRHALVDGAFARIRYLYSVWARRLPVDVQRGGLDAYRWALAPSCPAAADDDRFGRALLACSAGWLAVICAEVPDVMEADQRWGRSTIRQRIVTMIDHFVLLAEEFGGFPALSDAAYRLGRQLRSRWPAEDCEMAPYPAFLQRGGRLFRSFGRVSGRAGSAGGARRPGWSRRP